MTYPALPLSPRGRCMPFAALTRSISRLMTVLTSRLGSFGCVTLLCCSITSLWLSDLYWSAEPRRASARWAENFLMRLRCAAWFTGMKGCSSNGWENGQAADAGLRQGLLLCLPQALGWWLMPGYLWCLLAITRLEDTSDWHCCCVSGDGKELRSPTPGPDYLHL